MSEILRILAVPGLAFGAFALTFTLTNLRHRGAAPRDLALFGILTIGSALLLADPSVIRPVWLQYLALALIPALAGFIFARVLTSRETAP